MTKLFDRGAPGGLIFLRQDNTKFVNIDGNDNNEQQADDMNIPVDEENPGVDDAPEEDNVGVEDELVILDDLPDLIPRPAANHDAETTGVGFANDNNNKIAGVDDENINDENINDKAQLHDNDSSDVNEQDDIDVQTDEQQEEPRNASITQGEEVPKWGAESELSINNILP